MMNNDRLNKFGMELGELLEFQNISINDYAERIGTTSKNLIDIIDGKVPLSFNMICNIAFISDYPVSYIVNVEESFKIKKGIDKYIQDNNITLKNYINHFNYKELADRYNLVYSDERNDYSIIKTIFKYLRITNPNILYKEDNTILYKSKCDKPELLALWLERCYRLSQEQNIKEYSKDNINYLVELIRNEAKNNRFDEDRLIKEFNDKGIYLVIEDDLKGSKIRGAFKVLNTKPAIYITRKHKRIADIYFALLHELAHCKTDFNRAKRASIVSLYNYASDSDYEIKADKTALNWMVPDNEYEKIINNNDYNYEIMSFLVYRLALDKKISYSSKMYQDNNKLLYIGK